VKVAPREVVLFLSNEGQQALQLAGAYDEESPAAVFHVQETDELGLWVRVMREDGEQMLLVRWEYVLSLDFPVGEAKTLGKTRQD